MTTATTNTSSLNDLIAPIVQEAMFVASETSIMPGLVKNFTVPANAGKVLQVPLYGTQTIATDVGENAEIDMTAISTGVANITLTEAGIAAKVTDMSRNHSTSNVIADLGKLFGEAIAKRHDRALTGLFSTFTASINDSTDTQSELSVTDLHKAYATLKKAGVPGPYYGVFTPQALFALKSTLTNTFTNPTNSLVVTNQAMSEGFIGRIAGIDVFETSNIVEDSATSAVCGVFARDALGLAVAQRLNVETERDASLRAEEVVASTRYGVSVLHNSYGVKIAVDNTI